MPRESVGSLRYGRVLPTEPYPGSRVRRAWDAFLARPCKLMTIIEACDDPNINRMARTAVLMRLRDLGLDIRNHGTRVAKNSYVLYWCVGREMPDGRYIDFLADRLDNA